MTPNNIMKLKDFTQMVRLHQGIRTFSRIIEPFYIRGKCCHVMQ